MGKTGKVWLVGAGPSDALLLTLKGKHVLESADVVVYDKLVGQGVLTMIPHSAEKIDVGKSAGNHPVCQEEINQILLDQALLGKNVVRLKGGDPFLFGRGGEELELLCENNIPFEIVPGITSAIAVPAYAGIPVTHRSLVSSLHIITGHAKKGSEVEIDYEALVKLKGTLIFLMSLSSLPDICAGLLGAGMAEDMPAAILEQGTRAAQRNVISTLKDIVGDAAANHIKTPSIIIVGEVCTFAEKFSWAHERALGGMRVVNARPNERASELTVKLQDQGAEVIEFPCMKTVVIEPNARLEQAAREIQNYDWIVLTSPVGVDVFFTKLAEYGLDIRELRGIKFAAVGEATAKKIRSRGISVDYIPKDFNGGRLGFGLQSIAEGKKLLIARAYDGTQELIEAIKDKLEYQDIPIYKTESVIDQAEEIVEIVRSGEYDVVMFTSASAVEGFVDRLRGTKLQGVHALCIGEQTAAAARKYDMEISISETASLDSMVQELIKISESGGEKT